MLVCTALAASCRRLSQVSLQRLSTLLPKIILRQFAPLEDPVFEDYPLFAYLIFGHVVCR